MTKLEHDAWLAVANALDSIFTTPSQGKAIGEAMSAICDLLEDEPNSKGILTSCPESPDYSPESSCQGYLDSSPGKTHYADDATIRHIVELEAEVERLRGHAKRLMRASRQLLNDSRQQPRDYAREAIARYLEDYPEEAER